jgi:hypothetical protein
MIVVGGQLVPPSLISIAMLSLSVPQSVTGMLRKAGAVTPMPLPTMLTPMVGDRPAQGDLVPAARKVCYLFPISGI